MDLNEAFYFSKRDEFYVYFLNTCSILTIKKSIFKFIFSKKFSEI